MPFFEVIQSLLVSVLVAYLSFTNSLASYIETQFSPESPQAAVSSDTPLAAETQAPPSTELSLFSRIFAQTGATRILTESEVFRNAFAGVPGEANVISTALDTATSEDATRSAIVNIFCEYETDTYTRTTTGTGFFIRDTGVILTNAHVAQFLLLEGVDSSIQDASCVIRNGDPALPQYRAELLFISPTWIFTNAKLITAEHPRGTGEYDYALLYVSESLTDTPLPATFPSLPIHTDFLAKSLTGTSIVTAGYPAEKLEREGSHAALIPAVATSHIIELYTFGSNYADIFSIAESPVGEQGASGGPVVQNELGTIGLIVTKGDPATEGERSLRALTLSYIDRTIREETGYSLLDNASGNLTYRGKVFKEVLAPFLTKLLTNELDE